MNEKRVKNIFLFATLVLLVVTSFSQTISLDWRKKIHFNYNIDSITDITNDSSIVHGFSLKSDNVRLINAYYYGTSVERIDSNNYIFSLHTRMNIDNRSDISFVICKYVISFKLTYCEIYIDTNFQHFRKECTRGDLEQMLKKLNSLSKEEYVERGNVLSQLIEESYRMCLSGEESCCAVFSELKDRSDDEMINQNLQHYNICRDMLIGYGYIPNPWNGKKAVYHGIINYP